MWNTSFQGEADELGTTAIFSLNIKKVFRLNFSENYWEEI